MHAKIARYIRLWKARGYSDDIPDEVPPVLMQQQLAPSYRAVAIAILKNDHAMQSLGFSVTPSPWYSVLKGIEIAGREGAHNVQLDFWK